MSFDVLNDVPVLSVTEVSLTLKSCVEKTFSKIKVRGEVFGVKKAPSGHTYFSLKDNDSVLSAISWRGRDTVTTNALTEGMEIICTGKLSTYPGRSTYQMIVESAEPAGIGALLKLLNERKEKLRKEGLFDEIHKKNIPYLPKIIGVITSPAGAVIQDIIHRISDRFPRHILLWPVLVQGEGASEQISNAILGMNKIPLKGIQTPSGLIPRPDVIIVARGGGSLEDLWCFNEENVVRATFQSDIPIISAVGHETDTTLIDYVSDLRAPTPTGAAEKSVPVRNELILKLSGLETSLKTGLMYSVNDKDASLKQLQARLPNLNDVIENFFQKLDDQTERLNNAIQTFINTLFDKQSYLSKLLESYSYKSVLQRGFAFVQSSDGEIISSAQQAKKQSDMILHFHDGNQEVFLNKNNKKQNKKQYDKEKDQQDLFL